MLCCSLCGGSWGSKDPTLQSGGILSQLHASTWVNYHPEAQRDHVFYTQHFRHTLHLCSQFLFPKLLVWCSLEAMGHFKNLANVIDFLFLKNFTDDNNHKMLMQLQGITDTPEFIQLSLHIRWEGPCPQGINVLTMRTIPHLQVCQEVPLRTFYLFL